jgi:hypothetical protein
MRFLLVALAVVLLGGLVAAVIWFVPGWSARSHQPHAKGPPGGDTGKGPSDGKPDEEKLPEITLADLQAAIDQAGAEIKLAPQEFRIDGVDLTIDLPEGAVISTDVLGAEITWGEHFGVVVMRGRGPYRVQRWNEAGVGRVASTRDLLFHDVAALKGQSCLFCLNVAAGHLDFFVEDMPVVDGKFRTYSRADCLLMLKSARTLALQTPPPADPVEALEQLRVKLKKDDAGTVREVRLGFLATDRTLALLKHLPDVETLSSDGALLTDAGLVHLTGLTKLKTLNLDHTQVTDAAVPVLSGLTKLGTLSLQDTRITAAGKDRLQRALPGVTIVYGEAK